MRIEFSGRLQEPKKLEKFIFVFLFDTRACVRDRDLNHTEALRLVEKAVVLSMNQVFQPSHVGASHFYLASARSEF
jgi:hypothetical protein